MFGGGGVGVGGGWWESACKQQEGRRCRERGWCGHPGASCCGGPSSPWYAALRGGLWWTQFTMVRCVVLCYNHTHYSWSSILQCLYTCFLTPQKRSDIVPRSVFSLWDFIFLGFFSPPPPPLYLLSLSLSFSFLLFILICKLACFEIRL